MTLILGIGSQDASAAQTTGTFTVAAMNVDGLPQKLLGFISLNGDGPGSDGTKAISQKIATTGWDLFAVSENFSYHNELKSALTNYSHGTHRGGITGLNNNTDGLNLFWKNSISVTGESWVKWNHEYSTGVAGSGNGADSMIDKGYRYYQAAIAEGVNVDVYILHMDAASDAGDIDAREKQLTQLVNAIKASRNGNPILIMGDTNSRYTREKVQSILIDGINAVERFTIQDAWVEKIWNGVYPGYGDDPLVAEDKFSDSDRENGYTPYPYPQAEVVDKIFYINNTDSDVTLEALSFAYAMDFVKADGTPLADHWPVVVEFRYTIGPKECAHQYAETRVEATCEAEGSVTRTCSLCGDSLQEAISALGHDYRTVTVSPTCTADGSVTTACTRCDSSSAEVLPATGHLHTQLRNAAVPGCEAEGYTGDTWCIDCNTQLSSGAVIAALGHTWNDGITTREPTADAEGILTFTCATCGGTRTETMPRLPIVKDPSVSLTLAQASSGKIVIEGIIDDYANTANSWEITGQGLLYIQASRIGTRTLTVNTSGRTRVNFSGCSEDGSFSYSFKPSSKTTVYAFRAFITYQDPETGAAVTVYSPMIRSSYNGITG
ncbi:MAG: hypothetical protein IKU31_00105 [Oscillospiraceae bacterium]|nr:hypothetical protein [Oscillospiraceae bacterium]